MTTSENKDEVLDKMIEMFGKERIADPDIFPNIFAYQVRLAKYQIFIEKPPSTEITIEGEPEEKV